MKPDETTTDRSQGHPLTPQRTTVQTPPSRNPQYRQQEAAANIIRGQINTLYGDSSPGVNLQVPAESTTHVQPEPTPSNQPTQTQSAPVTTAAQQPEEIQENPYERTHTRQVAPQPEVWKQYHSAWQDYYQKYYAGYYAHQAKRVVEASQQHPAQQAPVTQSLGWSSLATSKADTESEPSDTVDQQTALQELRSKLVGQVQQSAKKIRKSRHFVPAIAALGVVLIFVFIQYNQFFIANVKAYVTPGSIDPQNIIVDPNEAAVVGPEARLIIPKINVDTPVFYDVAIDNTSQQAAMENGVAHFPIPGANSHPGEVGNTVLSGHSSNDIFATGAYKNIFVQLGKLTVGDTIYANYNGVRYSYVVTKSEEVLPTQVGKLVYETDKPVMTLITCTPVGTALRRLLETAEQVNPAPASAAPAPASSGTGSSEEASIPGQGAPTLIERVFGG